MPDPRQLPHLLKLLEDDSYLVQQAVLKELAAFGESLEKELLRLPKPPTSAQKQMLKALLKGRQRDWLVNAWPGWFHLKNEAEKLEAAHALIAEFQSGPDQPPKLTGLLDRLAEEYQKTHPEKDVYALSRFLFQTQGLKGAAPSDYYNPFNSNLVYVIEQKRGIPISLVCIYLLTGHRLGLGIEGCNFPGHFLARTYYKDRLVLVDCFNGGQFLDEETLLMMNQKETSFALKDVIRSKTDAKTIMERVLLNLMRAYQEVGNAANLYLMRQLLNLLEGNAHPKKGKDAYVG